MKKNKFTLLVFLCMFSLVAMATEKGFKVTGTTSGLPDGAVVSIIAYDEDGEPSDFVKTTVKGDKFELKGVIDEPFLGFVAVRGEEESACPIFLENANFNITIGKDFKDCKLTGGGKDQILANRFHEAETGRYNTLIEFEEEYEKIYNADHSKIDHAKLTDIIKRQTAFTAECNKKYYELVKSNPDTYVTTTYIAWGKNTFALEFLKDYYAALSDRMKNSEYGGYIAQAIKSRSAKVHNLGDYKLMTTEGKEVKLSDYKSKVKVIDIWASWCGPCKFYHPLISELINIYKGKDFKFIGISLDTDKEAWKKSVAGNAVKYVQLTDLKGWQNDIYKSFNVDGIPLVAVLDKDNNVVMETMNIGELIRKINELLAK